MALNDHNQLFEKFLAEVQSGRLDDSLVTDHWRQRREQIKSDARTRSRFEFLRWPSLGDFSVPENWVPARCYDELRDSPAWESRWFPLTRETKVGYPMDHSRDFGTSPIATQHAYHLFRYERATGRRLTDCDVIFEVGGGYGSFCRILRDSGFSGLHVIYDLPEVSSIQRLYLGLSGLTEVPAGDIARTDRHVISLITDRDLDDVFRRLRSAGLRVGFVATWSLSETPLVLRDRFFPRFHPLITQYLIAYQPGWRDLNNMDYFDQFEKMRPEIEMRREELQPSFYLFA